MKTNHKMNLEEEDTIEIEEKVKLNVLYQYPQKDVKKYYISIFSQQTKLLWGNKENAPESKNTVTTKSKELPQKVKQKDKELQPNRDNKIEGSTQEFQ